MGGGGGVIDPPLGPLFQDPAEMPNIVPGVPGLVEVNMEARAAVVDINGTPANLLTYNSLYPAPTIRVRKGDLLRVHFTNSIPPGGTNLLGHAMDVTNLHTHGLHVSPSGKADNVMLAWWPGDSFTYEYDLSLQDGGSLNFYHPHIHGTVAEQYWKGLAGAIVVEDEVSALGGYETHVMTLKDIDLSGSEPAPYAMMMDYMHGKEGNIVMVNGQVNPELRIRPGQVQRWRVLNASNARFYHLSLEGHPMMYLVGSDGGLLDRPYPISRILLSPGERVDLLVKADQASAKYRLLSLPYSRMGANSGQQVTLLTLSYKGSRSNQGIPSMIDPEARRVNAMPMAIRSLALGMGQGRGYINGITFEGMDQAYRIASHTGTWEEWEIANDSGMDHPFHQHTNPCQVLAISGGDSGYASIYTSAPAWKDTVIVPKWGSIRILIPVKDYGGMAMFHCHIPEHEDIGMMGVWDIMGGMGGM